ncbi:hypothetical protein [Heyndrickxia acidicola]|uniref:Uncharacterized protein n=1 Tax=Heyndrickxia acidicola TaxID=209389 RepID=A0ABU6MK38_9BACI|nr:hypothetical protein [Heyndrickxia acidicola]MED1203415.1 hypothetical protein [Heyndrickxia acidicola]
MKANKKKVAGIVASLGLGTSLLAACSNDQLVTSDNYKNYDCEKATSSQKAKTTNKSSNKKDEDKCEDTTHHGSSIYIPGRYVSRDGRIKSSFVTSSENVLSGSKGLGSSREPSGS